MSVNLREDGAVLKLELAEQLKLPHPVGDTLLLEVELISGYVLECLLDALRALLELLLFLVAEGHVMKEYEEIEFVAAAEIEVDDVHDPVGLLQQVERLLPLLSLDELDG